LKPLAGRASGRICGRADSRRSGSRKSARPAITRGMAEADITVRVAQGVGSLDAAQWDGLTGGGNPFMRHAFLSSLEDSGSVGEGTGWQALPLVIEDASGHLLAALPAYAKF